MYFYGILVVQEQLGSGWTQMAVKPAFTVSFSDAKYSDIY
jgi:hypothetical protein